MGHETHALHQRQIEIGLNSPLLAVVKPLKSASVVDVIVFRKRSFSDTTLLLLLSAGGSAVCLRVLDSQDT